MASVEILYISDKLDKLLAGKASAKEYIKYLQKEYTIFGRITEGIEALSILKDLSIARDIPLIRNDKGMISLERLGLLDVDVLKDIYARVLEFMVNELKKRPIDPPHLEDVIEEILPKIPKNVRAYVISWLLATIYWAGSVDEGKLCRIYWKELNDDYYFKNKNTRRDFLYAMVQLLTICKNYEEGWQRETTNITSNKSAVSIREIVARLLEILEENVDILKKLDPYESIWLADILSYLLLYSKESQREKIFSMISKAKLSIKDIAGMYKLLKNNEQLAMRFLSSMEKTIMSSNDLKGLIKLASALEAKHDLQKQIIARTIELGQKKIDKLDEYYLEKYIKLLIRENRIEEAKEALDILAEKICSANNKGKEFTEAMKPVFELGNKIYTPEHNERFLKKFWEFYHGDYKSVISLMDPKPIIEKGYLLESIYVRTSMLNLPYWARNIEYIKEEPDALAIFDVINAVEAESILKVKAEAQLLDQAVDDLEPEELKRRIKKVLEDLARINNISDRDLGFVAIQLARALLKIRKENIIMQDSFWKAIKNIAHIVPAIYLALETILHKKIPNGLRNGSLGMYLLILRIFRDIRPDLIDENLTWEIATRIAEKHESEALLVAELMGYKNIAIELAKKIRITNNEKLVKALGYTIKGGISLDVLKILLLNSPKDMSPQIEEVLDAIEIIEKNKIKNFGSGTSALRKYIWAYLLTRNKNIESELKKKIASINIGNPKDIIDTAEKIKTSVGTIKVSSLINIIRDPEIPSSTAKSFIYADPKIEELMIVAMSSKTIKAYHFANKNNRIAIDIASGINKFVVIYERNSQLVIDTYYTKNYKQEQRRK